MTDNAQICYSVCLVRPRGIPVISNEEIPLYCIGTTNLFGKKSVAGS